MGTRTVALLAAAALELAAAPAMAGPKVYDMAPLLLQSDQFAERFYGTLLPPLPPRPRTGAPSRLYDFGAVLGRPDPFANAFWNQSPRPLVDCSGAIFFGRWLRDPRGVGSVLPSGHRLARAIAAPAAAVRGSPVLELGGGTGTVTDALLECGLDPRDLIVIERDADMHGYLKARYPQALVVRGDAAHSHRLLAEHGIAGVGAVVSTAAVGDASARPPARPRGGFPVPAGGEFPAAVHLWSGLAHTGQNDAHPKRPRQPHRPHLAQRAARHRLALRAGRGRALGFFGRILDIRGSRAHLAACIPSGLWSVAYARYLDDRALRPLGAPSRVPRFPRPRSRCARIEA